MAVRTNWISYAAAIAIVTAIGGGMVWYYFSPHISRYTAVVAALDDGRLKPDAGGHVDLSRDFPGVVPADHILFQRRPDGSYAALFPTTIGPGVSLSGLVYTSRPLKDGDTFQRPNNLGQNRPRIKVGPYENLLISERIDDHWFRASFLTE